jgi:DNA replication initiation complex subunit (GINS family)
MASYCPSIDWLNYFLAMDRDRQREFETDLASRDIGLGEYMEIVEQAAMEAYARTPSNALRPNEEELLVIVSAMLSDYVNRKRVLSTQTWEASTTRSSELSPAAQPLAAADRNAHLQARRVRLRAEIHGRIEAIKSGSATL